jgi:hypothetical protein
MKRGLYSSSDEDEGAGNAAGGASRCFKYRSWLLFRLAQSKLNYTDVSTGAFAESWPEYWCCFLWLSWYKNHLFLAFLHVV